MSVSERLTSNIPHQADLSVRGQTIQAVRHIIIDPAVDTSPLSEIGQYDPARDRDDMCDYADTKAERYAIAGAAIKVFVDDLVACGDDPRQARFRRLVEPKRLVSLSFTDIGFPIQPVSNHTLLGLRQDIFATTAPFADDFLKNHPEYNRAADRFADISVSIADLDENTAIDLVSAIHTGVATLAATTVSEYLPFVLRLIDETNGAFPELSYEHNRVEMAKDLADDMLFKTAGLNLAHLGAIDASDGDWSEFKIAINLRAKIVHGSGKWGIEYAKGSERPPKPRRDLAGATIGCAALLATTETTEDLSRQERIARLHDERQDDTPLHRLVYATLNAAHERTLFSNRTIEAAVFDIARQRHAKTTVATASS